MIATPKRVLLAGLLALLTIAAQRSPSQGGPGDWIIVGEEATVGQDDTVNGDVVVIGGTLHVESGGTVRGDVVVIGGDAELDGQVDGDLVTVGSPLDVGPDATVHGETIVVGGNLDVAQGAVLNGGYVTTPGPDLTGLRAFPPPRLPEPNSTFNTSRLILAPVNAIALSLLAAIALLAWPSRLVRIGKAASEAPAAAGGLGVLSIILFPLLSVICALTLLLIPVTIMLALLFVVVLLFGWAAVGLLLGERLLEWLGREDASARTAGIAGTFALTLMLGVFGAVPGLRLVGAVSGLLLLAVGVGAVVLTRLGSRSYTHPVSGDGPRRPRTEPQTSVTSEQT